MSDIEQLFSRLSPEHQQEARDFIEFLASKEPPKPPEKSEWTMAWRGALAHLKSDYTALELQKKAMEWRQDDVSR